MDRGFIPLDGEEHSYSPEEIKNIIEDVTPMPMKVRNIQFYWLTGKVVFTSNKLLFIVRNCIFDFGKPLEYNQFPLRMRNEKIKLFWRIKNMMEEMQLGDPFTLIRAMIGQSLHETETVILPIRCLAFTDKNTQIGWYVSKKINVIEFDNIPVKVFLARFDMHLLESLSICFDGLLLPNGIEHYLLGHNFFRFKSENLL